VSQCQKGKTNVDFTEARDSEWQWHQLGRTKVCTSLQTDNHASTPSLSFFTGHMPFLPPNQQCKRHQQLYSVGYLVFTQSDHKVLYLERKSPASVCMHVCTMKCSNFKHRTFTVLNSCLSCYCFQHVKGWKIVKKICTKTKLKYSKSKFKVRTVSK